MLHKLHFSWWRVWAIKSILAYSLTFWFTVFGQTGDFNSDSTYCWSQLFHAGLIPLIFHVSGSTEHALNPRKRLPIKSLRNPRNSPKWTVRQWNMLSVLPLKMWWFWQSRGGIAQAMIEEIKITDAKTIWLQLSFLSFFLHKFVKIVYDQLFHLSTVMAGINRPLNTGSCEFSILWLVASGITVVFLIWWNVPLHFGITATFHLAENKAADSTICKLNRIIRLLWGGFDGNWWSRVCFVQLLKKYIV